MLASVLVHIGIRKAPDSVTRKPYQTWSVGLPPKVEPARQLCAVVRRKFVDVFASQCNAIAEDALRRIAERYAVEKDARGKLDYLEDTFESSYNGFCERTAHGRF